MGVEHWAELAGCLVMWGAGYWTGKADGFKKGMIAENKRVIAQLEAIKAERGKK